MLVLNGFLQLPLSFENMLHCPLSLETWLHFKSLMNWLYPCVICVVKHSFSCNISWFIEIWKNGEILSFWERKCETLFISLTMLRWQVDETLIYWDTYMYCESPWVLVLNLESSQGVYDRLCDELGTTTSFYRFIIFASHWPVLLCCVTCFCVDLIIICTLMCLLYSRYSI